MASLRPRRVAGLKGPRYVLWWLVFTTAAVLGHAGAPPPRYSTLQTDDIVRLQDARTQTQLSLIPSVGNVAFDMRVKGEPILRFPYASVDEFKKAPRLSGIPFLGPWANRLDELGFYANGKHYTFNADLGNVRGPHPIHGLLASAAGWQVIEVKADAAAAWVTSKLEFFRQPAWMAQFPFAHTIEMTYRLSDGTLEVATRIANLSAEPMPVAIGFHPYFQLTDSPRDEWIVSIGARTQWLLSSDKIPTGETRPIAFPNPGQVALRDLNLDDVFGDLVRDAAGRAVMSVKGRSQRLDVLFGPHYRASVIYSPPTGGGGGTPQAQGFICFEPMAAITNALNMAHRGLYKDLQSIPPGDIWQESFWIRPSGF